MGKWIPNPKYQQERWHGAECICKFDINDSSGMA